MGILAPLKKRYHGYVSQGDKRTVVLRGRNRCNGAAGYVSLTGQACRVKAAKASLLKKIYNVLLCSLGPQHWWPAQTPFEVMVGAILVQNTNWTNVERVISHLKARRLLTAKKLNALDVERLALLIRPAGYFNVKAQRLKHFLTFFCDHYDADVRRMKLRDGAQLRQELLGVHGIGPETADSILLYALDKPFFVIDNYTQCIFARHKILNHDTCYQDAQQFFHRHLSRDVKVYNEYHALLVRLAKDFCRKKPLCVQCPLQSLPKTRCVNNN